MKIIALTSCPVGMAHTYMAAAALKKAAQKLGHEIKVETQGSMGIRDKITPEEVKEADVFILSADVAPLEIERFENVPTYETATSKVIKKSEEIISAAVASVDKDESEKNTEAAASVNKTKDEDIAEEAIATAKKEKEGENNGKKRWIFWRR